MYKVIIPYEKIILYFTAYENTKANHCYLYPTDDSIKEYWKYVSNYGKNNFWYNKILIQTPHDADNCVSKYWIKKDEFLEFTFPDEETAFYFKLKFC